MRANSKSEEKLTPPRDHSDPFAQEETEETEARATAFEEGNRR